jgi:hypothetical protein
MRISGLCDYAAERVKHARIGSHASSRAEFVIEPLRRTRRQIPDRVDSELIQIAGNRAADARQIGEFTLVTKTFEST